jgi:hypothetical protein
LLLKKSGEAGLRGEPLDAPKTFVEGEVLRAKPLKISAEGSAPLTSSTAFKFGAKRHKN